MLFTGLRTTVSPVAARLIVLLHSAYQISNSNPKSQILQLRENQVLRPNVLHTRPFQPAERAVRIDRIDDELAEEYALVLVDHVELHPLLHLLLSAKRNRRIRPALVGLHVANHALQ